MAVQISGGTVSGSVATAGGSQHQGGSLLSFLCIVLQNHALRHGYFYILFTNHWKHPKKLLTMGNTRDMMQSKARETPEKLK